MGYEEIIANTNTVVIQMYQRVVKDDTFQKMCDHKIQVNGYETPHSLGYAMRLLSESGFILKETIVTPLKDMVHLTTLTFVKK